MANSERLPEDEHGAQGANEHGAQGANEHGAEDYRPEGLRDWIKSVVATVARQQRHLDEK